MKKTEIFPVKGMHDGECSSRVESALRGMEGVGQVSAHPAEGTVVVEYDDALVQGLQIVARAEVAAKEPSGGIFLEKEIIDGERKYYVNLKKRMKVAWLFAIPITLVSVWLGNTPVARIVLAILTLLMLVYCAGRIFSNACRHLTDGVFHADMLTALAIGIAFVFSLSGMLFPGFWYKYYSMPPFLFDVTSLIVAFSITARVVGEYARVKSDSAVAALVEAVPQVVHVIDDNGNENDCPVKTLCPGNKIKVLAGEHIAVDGTVVSGISSTDESLLTGKKEHVQKNNGSRVFAGTVNVDDTIVVNVKALGSATTLAALVRSVQNAKNSSCKSGETMSNVVAVLVPAVISLSLLTYAVWLNQNGVDSIPRAVTALVNVLIVACPAAIGIAVPMAMRFAIDRGVDMHVYYNGAEAIRQLKKADTVVLDNWVLLFGGETAAEASVTEDSLPRNLKAFIAALHAGGKHLVLFADEGSVLPPSLEKEAGVDIVTCSAPSQKTEYISALRKQGHVVAFVCYGASEVSDRVEADVSVVMDKGGDVHSEAPLVSVPLWNITSLGSALRLANETMGLIRLNLVWAFIYNVAGLVIATGVVKFTVEGRLNPIIVAAIAACAFIWVAFNCIAIYTKRI